jgi:hypothetical protein
MKNIKTIINILLQRLFKIDTVIVFKMDNIKTISSPTEVKKADQNNIKDVLNFQDERYLKTFEEFLYEGKLGYLGYINKKCIHRSWVEKNENTIIYYHPLAQKRLAKNEIYIHYCETAVTARGNNVYPYVISKIAMDFPDKEVLICVNKKNHPSIKGVKKAGFKPIQSIKIFAILGLVFRSKKDYKGVEIDE